MKIKTKLRLNALLPLLAGIIILMVLLLDYKVETDLQKQDRIVYEVRTGIFELDQLTNSYFLYQEERPKLQWELLYRQLTGFLEDLELVPPARGLLVRRVVTDLGVMRALFLQLVSTYPTDVQSTNSALVADLQARLRGQLMVRARILRADINELAFQVDEDRAAMMRLNNTIIIATLLVLAFVLAATILRMNKTIIGSLARLRRGTELVGAGDLDHRLNFSGSDELSELAHAFDLMIEELQHTTVSRDKLRQSEEMLRRSEATLRLATEATRLGIFDFHPPTRELKWSDFAKLQFGLPPEAEVDYETFLAGLHPDDRDRIDQIVQEALQPASGGKYQAEYRTLGIGDGKERWLISSGLVFFDERGEPLRLIGATLDITERKRLEQELQKAQQLESIGLLAGGIAHDFNNILTAILGNINLAQMFLPPKNKAADRLAVAEQASMRARALSQQLLTFAPGGGPITKTTAVPHLVQEAVELCLVGSNVKSEYHFSGELRPVEADESQLNQALGNLALNAVEAMPEGGIVTVTVVNESLSPENALGLRPGDYVRIDIKDQGVGISAELRERIFDAYFTTKERGSGLGLAISFSIVKRHGGTITVDSAPGRGSLFSVFLPVSQK